MKVLFLLASVAILAVNADLMAYLKEIQGHHSFQSLSTADKILFSELVMAAETDTLEAFIDRVGLLQVVELIDGMSSGDGSKFSAYLAEHLGYHHHASSSDSILNKRDDSGEDSGDDSGEDSGNDSGEDSGESNEAAALKVEEAIPQVAQGRDGDDDDHHNFHGFFHINHNRYHFNLPGQEKATWDALQAAAKTDSVTAYIADHGYGEIFGLLEHLDSIHAEQLLTLLEVQLQKEAAAVLPPAKREEHNNFHGYFNNNHQQYHFNLPDQEKATWDALQAAAKTNTVTAYIDANGYGPIFGLLEHLDRSHADRLLYLLENQLEKEAAAAASAP